MRDRLSSVEELAQLLRCPRCGSPLSLEDGVLVCDQRHRYPVVRGVPRLLVGDGGSEEATGLIRKTSEAFGRQWTQFADAASVDRSDLLLHLPASWDASAFRCTALDVGCGMGRYTGLAAAEGAQVVGLDVSRAIDVAVERWPAAYFVQADVASPPFSPRTFDLVYSFGVLHHLPDPARGFRTCFELVRPDGRLLAWVYSEHRGVLRAGRRALRQVVSAAPKFLRPLSFLAAAAIWVGVVLPRKLLPEGPRKLGFYRNKGFRQLATDCYDALSAPAEMYLTEQDCRDWLSMLDARVTGFERRRDGSGWILWAQR